MKTPEQELSDIATAIGTVEFMDPPDGGDTPLSEQVRRLKASRDFYKARTRNALGTTYEPTRQRVTVYAADNSIDLLINLPNLVETLREVDKQVREGKSKRMDFIDSHLRAYPFDAGLPEQKRSFDETFSAGELVRQTFFGDNK